MAVVDRAIYYNPNLGRPFVGMGEVEIALGIVRIERVVWTFLRSEMMVVVVV